MGDNTIIWDGERMVSIHYGSNNKDSFKYESYNYDVISCLDTVEDGLFYVFVRREDGKYGILWTSRDSVLGIVASDYDDIYCDGLGVYESVEERYQNERDFFPTDCITTDSFVDPLCMVNKGVEGLLTCTPYVYDEFASEGSGWHSCPPFVCEAFSYEYIFLNNCVIRHNMHTGEMGKAWYRESHTQISYDDGGYNLWACYMYEKKYNSNSGRWRVIDGNAPSSFVDNIVADDILMANFWSDGHIVVGTTSDGQKELLFWDKQPEIKFRESIICAGWTTYYTKRHSLYIIKTIGGIKIYSGQAGLLSEKKYFFKALGHEYLHNESLVLQYYTKDKSIAQDILYIDDDGNVEIHES